MGARCAQPAAKPAGSARATIARRFTRPRGDAPGVLVLVLVLERRTPGG